MAKRSPRRLRESNDDPVTLYAKAVVAKTIIAGLLVRLACQRHLRDLEEGPARGLEWRPDQARAAIEFFEKVLYLPDEINEEIDLATDANQFDAIELAGKPFLLSPFQKFIVGSLCGWFTAEGYTRFRIFDCETGKGSGKTCFAAGILLLRLTIKAGINKQMYVAATQSDQARLTFRDAVNMVLASPALRKRLSVSANSIANLKTGSFIKPVSAEKRGLDGKRVDTAVTDEVQEQPTGIVVEKMRAGTKNRRNALLILMRNSGYDRTSVAWELREYSRQVLDGTIINDAWFAYICQLDPCDACYEKGLRAPSDKCPNCDQWHTEGPHWLKTNPNLGVSLPWEYLREQVREALGMPTKQAIVMRLNFCIWTVQHTIWIPAEKWEACRIGKSAEGNQERLTCTLGLDLSATTDLTAGVIALRHDDEPDKASDFVEVSVADEAGKVEKKTLNLNYSVEFIPFFWMPEDTLAERVQKDRLPFDVWKKQGHLFTTPGPVVDYDAVYDFIVDDLSDRYAIQQIGYDPWNATQFATQLRDRAKLTAVEVKQGKVLSEVAKLMHALVLSGRARHGGNAVMAYCVANAMAKYDRFENISIEKPSARQRIDGLIAALVALYLLVRLPARRRKKGRIPLVWTPDGLVPIMGTDGARGPTVDSAGDRI